MSALTNLALAPFAMFFRAAYAQPWLAVIVSVVVGLVCWFIGQATWAVIAASFMAYMLIWLDENRNPRPADTGTVED
jgi:lysylphosphatidylglycerol synthetase-like protein (DUF2156 family)